MYIRMYVCRRTDRPCGSIMSGYRRALLMIMPLSTENASVGRPAMFQLRILTGSPSVAFIENSSEHGIPFSFTCTHIHTHTSSSSSSSNISSAVDQFVVVVQSDVRWCIVVRRLSAVAYRRRSHQLRERERETDRQTERQTYT